MVGSEVTVVVGVDGAGRTHRLERFAALGPVLLVTPPIADGLNELLTDAAAAGHLVLVDDAHRLTGAELTVLTAVARQGCAMVIARRPTIDSPELADLDEAVAARGQVQQLRPLARDEVEAMLAQRFGQRPSADVVTALHTASAGLPGILVALTVDADPRATTTAAMTVPASLVARVQRRLARLDPSVVALARVLALRLDLADAVLTAASEVDGPTTGGFLGAVRALRDEGMLVPGTETMIPAVAEAVLADLPLAGRRRLHEAVARALIDAGTDVVAAADQLRAARAFIPAAAAVYRAVGDRIRFTDPAAALGWYDDAVEAGASPAELAAGRAEAAALLGLPVDVSQPAVAGQADRLALVDGAVEAHHGRADRSAQALVRTRPPGPVLAVPALVATGRLNEIRAEEGSGDEAAPRGEAGLRRLADAALLAATDPAASVAPLIEAAETLERTPAAVVLPDTAHALGALMASTSADVASAEYLLNRALTTRAGGPVAKRRHQLLLAWVRMRAGRYDTAVAELTRPAEADLSGRDRFLLAALSAGVARRSGDVARLREAWATVEPALARRAVDLFLVESVEELAVAATRLRRFARVAPVLDALDEIVAALGQPPPWAVAVGWIRLQVAIADEDTAGVASVAALIARAGRDASGVRQRAQCAAAEQWAAVMTGEVDTVAVLAAADSLVVAELPWEASRLVGQAAIRTTDAAVARRLLERARELSSAEVSTERRTETSHSGLSEREIEVARMVLAGDTYREIGGRLFISPKTVEHHVARIRTKLGATTRAEFLAALRRTLPVFANDVDQGR